jgi:hypothetical protein
MEAMSTAIFFVGCFVLFWGVYKRIERTEDRANQRELMERKRRHAKQWGFSEHEIHGPSACTLLEQRNWKETLKFEGVCWSLHILGALLLVVATATWFREKQSHSVSELVSIVGIMGAFVMLGVKVLLTDKRYEKLDMEIAWLNHTFKVMNDHSENMRTHLVARNLKFADRLDKLEIAHLSD